MSVDDAVNVANLLTSVVKGLGGQEYAAQQSPGQASSVMDVWTYSYEGMSQRINRVISDPTTTIDDIGDLAEGVGKSISGPSHGIGLDDAINAWKSQFTGLGKDLNAISKAKGALATIGATFAFLTSIEQLVTLPLSVIPFPAMPALRIADMDVGLPHAHNHPPNLTPPNPVPVPLPSTGPVIPIPILSGASKTLINGMPAARCGDMGLGIWCGGYFPMYEVFLGSSSVWIEGMRASRLAVDVTKHCTFTSPKPSDPPMGPMVGFTVSASPNVLIGGVPMPSLLNLAIGAAIKLLFKGLEKVVQRLGKSKEGLSSIARKAPSTSDTVVQRLSGRATGYFPPEVTPNVYRILRDCRIAGSRIEIPNGINARELAALTAATGDEFAVVWNKERRTLELLRGTSEYVQPGPHDVLLVHTHPDEAAAYATNISVEDRLSAAASDNPHPEAVITADGVVHHFDGNGVVENPKLSPIGRDGHISGLYTSPTGAPISAVPPGFFDT